MYSCCDASTVSLQGRFDQLFIYVNFRFKVLDDGRTVLVIFHPSFVCSLFDRASSLSLSTLTILSRKATSLTQDGCVSATYQVRSCLVLCSRLCLFVSNMSLCLSEIHVSSFSVFDK